MSHRLSQNARNTNELLCELERDKELDVLRQYLTEYQLFPNKRDPSSAPIRFEELKELAKFWKLHRQRNFWKNHSTKEDLVRTLFRHINSTLLPREINVDPDSMQNMSPELRDINSTTSGVKLCETLHLGPTHSNLFNQYHGDLFGQRGEYENGMIYLSRFQKPGMTLDSQCTSPSSYNTNQDALESNCDNDFDEGLEQDECTIDEADSTHSTYREIRLKREAAFGIYYFTTDIGNEIRMVSEGCMHGIASLSSFDDIDVKRFCAGAIVNLIYSQDVNPRMIEEGALMALIELAKTQHEEVRRNTSIALCRFSYDPLGQFRLIQEGCVPAIISMLNSLDYPTKEACVKALVNISSYAGSSIPEQVVNTIVLLSSPNSTIILPPTEIPLSMTALAAESMYNLSLFSVPRSKVVGDGILENVGLMATLSSADGISSPTNLHIATAICNFSGLYPNLEQLNRPEIIKGIDILLKCDDLEVRERCAITIANLSLYPPSLNNLVLSESVPLLMDGCKNGATPIILENVGLIMSNIAWSPEHRPFLARLDVVSLLLLLLESGKTSIMEHALNALCSLSMSAETISDILKVSTLNMIATVSSPSYGKVRELCAHVLFNLSCDASISMNLLQYEVIATLVRFCKQMITDENGNIVEMETRTDKSMVTYRNQENGTPVRLSITQEFAIQCIFNLSFLLESRKSLMDASTVPILVGVFSRPTLTKNENGIKHCSAILANLTFDIESCTALISSNILPLVRKFMSYGDDEALLCCAIICCNLAIESLEQTPVLQMLIDLTKTNNGNIMIICAMAFSKLASNEYSRATLSKCAELFPAMIIMMRCGIEEVQMYSTTTLCSLALEQSQRSRHIWYEGTVSDFIVNSLLRINSDSTKEICAQALFNLLTHEDYRNYHIKDGVLYAMVKLARLDSMRIRALCVTTLFNLSCDSSMVDTLIEINISQVILKICEIEFTVPDIYRKLAATLMHVARKDQTEIKLVEGGILTAILVLLEQHDPETVEYCTATLCLLSKYPVNCEAMASTNFVDLISRIIRSDNEQLHVLGLNTLCNISCCPKYHDRFEESGAISPILQLLSSSTDERVLLAAGQTLLNLTFENKFRKLMLQQEIIWHFHVLFDRESKFVGVVNVCARLAAVLSEELLEGCYLIKNGMVRILKTLSLYCSSAAMLCCLYALNQLSRNETSGQQVLQDGAMDILHNSLSFVKNSEVGTNNKDEITLRCSLVLRTLSAALTSLEPLMNDSRLIPMVHNIIDIGNQEACKNCILSLYNISSTRSPHGIHKLVQQGLIKVIIKLAQSAGPELTSVCGVTLARVKHIYKDCEAINDEQGNEIRLQLEDGMVKTLLPAVDFDQTRHQKIDRKATMLPTSKAPVQSSEWIFQLGDHTVRLVPKQELIACWEVLFNPSASLNFVPAEPKVYLKALAPQKPLITATLQDKVHGSFHVMKVSQTKFQMKRVDPALKIPSATSSSETIPSKVKIGKPTNDNRVPISEKSTTLIKVNERKDDNLREPTAPLQKHNSFQASPRAVSRVTSKLDLKRNMSKNAQLLMKAAKSDASFRRQPTLRQHAAKSSSDTISSSARLILPKI